MKPTRSALMALILISTVSSAHAGEFFARIKGGWLGLTGAENVTALNSGGYISYRQGISADGFAPGIDFGYRSGEWDFVLTGSRTFHSASSYGYLTGFMPTFDAIGSRDRKLYFGFLFGGMFLTQQNFVSTAMIPSPATYSINRFVIGPTAGFERPICTFLDLGAQLQYAAAFGPDQNLGAVLLSITLGHSF